MKWIDNNTISLEWSVEDVEQQLQDAEMGITWIHLDLYIDQIIEERKGKE